MSRAQNKADLLLSSQTEFKKLVDLVQSLNDAEQTTTQVCGKWTVKDLLAHLHEWHMMVISWYELDKRGEKPYIPAEGYTWKQTPELNERIYQTYKDRTFDDIYALLNRSYAAVQSIINAHTDEELFTKKYYKWTGTSSLGSYLVSCTASHYLWARKEIEKARKLQSIGRLPQT